MKIIGVIGILLCLGCAAKNYSTMTDIELQKALSDRQTSYNRNAANYHKYANNEPTSSVGGGIGGAMGSLLGTMINAVSAAKAAQTDKQEMEKIRQEMDRR